MEGEICQYQKYGYCRFKNECNKRHLSSECEDLECKNSKGCEKRHPKRCKRYASGNCRFENCAYKHQKPTIAEDPEQLKEKLQVIEKVLHAMTRKVLSLETEVEQLKKKSNIESLEGSKMSKKVEKEESKKKAETKKEVYDEASSCEIKKDLKTVSKPNVKEVSVFKFGAEARKTVVEEKKAQEKDLTTTDFKCEVCDYKCKKKSTLKNHIKLKHSEHKCEACGKEFKESMELVSHMAEKHNKEEEVWNVNFQSTPKSEKETEKSSFIFSESMLDEFL